MANKPNDNLIVQKGTPIPLGVSRGNGFFNFSVALKDVDECQLNLYVPGESVATYSIKMDRTYKFGDVFCVAIKGVQLQDMEYEYLVFGNKVEDRYAKKISGKGDFGKALTKEEQKFVRAVVSVDKYNWKDDVKPRIPFDEMIMYKLHVRGYTMHSSSRLANKGTFKGLSSKIEYLKELGVNAVVLMPVYEFEEISFDKYLVSVPDPKFVPFDEFERMRNEETLDPVMAHYTASKARQGIVPYKVNYWGYGVKAYYMAPKSSYASDKNNPAKEYKDLVKKFHDNGMEVIMEMSFEQGLSIHYIIDCLRHWVLEYHIDGFKISRNDTDIEMLAKDPLLCDVKIISESFDEYRVYGGEYNPIYKNLAVMNVEYMNSARRFMKGDEEQVGDFSYRFRRNPYRTGIINYVTNSDGFTLNDLYSYDMKHNEANGENNKDGENYNYSWNCGVEGITRKRKVINARNKQICNMLVTLLLSQGTPMLLAGDEFGNTQLGNNNPYCQDNEISWINWQNLRYNKKQFELVKQLIKFRKEHKVFHLKNEARMMDYISCGYPDMSYHGTKAWYPDYTNYSRTLGIMLYDKYCQVQDNTFSSQSNGGIGECADIGKMYYVAYNMHWEEHEFDLPKLPDCYQWKQIYNSSKNSYVFGDSVVEQNKTCMISPRTVVVLEGAYDETTKQINRGKNEAVQSKKRKKNDVRTSDK